MASGWVGHDPLGKCTLTPVIGIEGTELDSEWHFVFCEIINPIGQQTLSLGKKYLQSSTLAKDLYLDYVETS